MRRFQSGEIKVLVSTSVIEVGVDVPNATVMLIDGADRFGLAQLHQFRGRVGRGSKASACLLLADKPSEAARERLQYLARTSDGIKLAEFDLKTRGPGDYFGLAQSGRFDLFKFARLGTSDALTLASQVAIAMIEEDPQLQDEENAELRKRVLEIHTGASRV